MLKELLNKMKFTKKLTDKEIVKIKDEEKICPCTNLIESQGKIYCKECGEQK